MGVGGRLDARPLRWSHPEKTKKINAKEAREAGMEGWGGKNTAAGWKEEEEEQEGKNR